MSHSVLITLTPDVYASGDIEVKSRACLPVAWLDLWVASAIPTTKSISTSPRLGHEDILGATTPTSNLEQTLSLWQSLKALSLILGCTCPAIGEEHQPTSAADVDMTTLMRLRGLC